MKKIDNVIDPLIEFARNNSRYEQGKMILGDISYAKQYQTLKIDLGRQVGKSFYVARTATPNDLVLCYNTATVKTMNERAGMYNKIEQVDVHDVRGLGKVPFEQYDTIYIDDASYVDKERIEAVYEKFAGKCNLFVLIG